MEETTIKFLTCDGALCATFEPGLTSGQYDELLIGIYELEGFGEMKQLLEGLAGKWGRRATVSPC